MAQTVTLQLPEAIYERIKRTAEAANCLLEDILLRTIESALPPSVEDLPLEQFLNLWTNIPISDRSETYDMELTVGDQFVAEVRQVTTPTDVIPVGRSVVWH